MCSREAFSNRRPTTFSSLPITRPESGTVTQAVNAATRSHAIIFGVAQMSIDGGVIPRALSGS